MAHRRASIRAALVAVGVLVAIWSPPAAAGEIGPKLATALAAADAGDEIAVIVDFHDRFEAASVKRAGGRAERRAALVRELRRRSEAAQAPVRELLRARGVTDYTVLWAINGLAVEATPEIIRGLAARPEVAEVRLDATVVLARPKAAAAAEPEWNLEMVGAPELWARGHTGEGVVVAVLDTGVDPLHQDLAERYRGGGNSWFDPYGEHDAPHDADGHGTQAAGLIVGDDAGGTAIGMAPGARWIAARVLQDSDSGTLSEIHEAMQWLLDPDGDPGTDDAPDIVNNSWGFQEQVDECYPEFAEDIGLLRAAGIAVVFSAGNSGPASDSSVSPGNNAGAFPVGGVDGSGQVMSSSSRGPSACGSGTYPAVVAPGLGVRTSDLTFGGVVPDSYTAVSGTSFAAPHVSGAAALLLSAHPEATVAQLEQALTEGAEDLGADGPDNDSGWGLLDVVRAESVLAALVGNGGGVTVFTDEVLFSAAIGGADTVQEDFESDGAWSATRSPGAVPTVTSQGITWRSNHPDNQVSTSNGAARSGEWGFYSNPHGDQGVPNPTDFIEDGFVGTSGERLTAVGAWFAGTAGGKLRLVLDGDDANPVELGPIDPGHRFYGVVVDAGFTSFEFREVEGKLEDQKFVFADDVTLAIATGGNSPPDGTIVRPATDVTVAAGQAVFFEGSATDPDGDTVTVAWDFGDGTSSNQVAPGNRSYSAAGSYVVTFTATDEHGLADPTPDTRTITVTAGPPPLMTGVIAGVADVRGAAGSDWHTDLYLHNASADTVLVELYFSPADGTVGAPEVLTVAAGHTESLPDVVSTTFGASGSGAIFWHVSSGDATALLVSANTYNRVDAVRRYGQQVPGQEWADAAPAGTSIWVPALAGPYRTNLGFATDGDCTGVRIRAIDRTGVIQAERMVDVEPYSWQQLNKLFRRVFRDLIADPDTVAVADSLHRFEVVGIDGRVMAYTSIIDNVTSDGSYMLGQLPGSAGGTSWLPGAAFVRGVNDSQWRSDVMVFNLSDGADSAVVTYYPSDTDNGGVLADETIDFAAGDGSFQGNILRELFGLRPPAVGSLSVTAAEGLLWMRTYTEEPSSEGFTTYGQAVPPFAVGATITDSREGVVAGFSADDRTRANLILQNTAAGADGALLPVTVRVDVLDRSGAMAHRESYALRAGEYLQHNGFIVDYGLGSISGGALRVVVIDPPPETSSGGVLAVVSEVNGAELDGTNDGRLISAQVVESAALP
jgi:bacillopeptidase F